MKIILNPAKIVIMLPIKNLMFLVTKSVLFVFAVLLFLSVLPDSAHAGVYCGGDYYIQDGSDVVKSVAGEGSAYNLGIGDISSGVCAGEDFYYHGAIDKYSWEPVLPIRVKIKKAIAGGTGSVTHKSGNLEDSQICGSDFYYHDQRGNGVIYKVKEGSSYSTSLYSGRLKNSICIASGNLADFYYSSIYDNETMYKSRAGESGIWGMAEGNLENAHVCGGDLYYHQWISGVMYKSTAGGTISHNLGSGYAGGSVCQCGASEYYFQNGPNVAQSLEGETTANNIGSGTVGSTYGSESCTAQAYIFGCTNSNALNYNPLATKNDSSCEYGDVELTCLYPEETCEDSDAENYGLEGDCLYGGNDNYDDNNSCIDYSYEDPDPDAGICTWDDYLYQHDAGYDAGYSTGSTCDDPIWYQDWSAYVSGYEYGYDNGYWDSYCY